MSTTRSQCSASTHQHPHRSPRYAAGVLRHQATITADPWPHLFSARTAAWSCLSIEAMRRTTTIWLVSDVAPAEPARVPEQGMRLVHSAMSRNATPPPRRNGPRRRRGEPRGVPHAPQPHRCKRKVALPNSTIWRLTLNTSHRRVLATCRLRF